MYTLSYNIYMYIVYWLQNCLPNCFYILALGLGLVFDFACIVAGFESSYYGCLYMVAVVVDVVVISAVRCTNIMWCIVSSEKLILSIICRTHAVWLYEIGVVYAVACSTNSLEQCVVFTFRFVVCACVCCVCKNGFTEHWTLVLLYSSYIFQWRLFVYMLPFNCLFIYSYLTMPLNGFSSMCSCFPSFLVCLLSLSLSLSHLIHTRAFC